MSHLLAFHCQFDVLLPFDLLYSMSWPVCIQSQWAQVQKSNVFNDTLVLNTLHEIHDRHLKLLDRLENREYVQLVLYLLYSVLKKFLIIRLQLCPAGNETDEHSQVSFTAEMDWFQASVSGVNFVMSSLALFWLSVKHISNKFGIDTRLSEAS